MAHVEPARVSTAVATFVSRRFCSQLYAWTRWTLCLYARQTISSPLFFGCVISYGAWCSAVTKADDRTFFYCAEQQRCLSPGLKMRFHFQSCSRLHNQLLFRSSRQSILQVSRTRLTGRITILTILSIISYFFRSCGD